MVKLKVGDVVQDDTSLFNSKSISYRNHTMKTPFKLLDFNETPAITKIDNWKSDALNEIDVVEISRLISENRFCKELNNSEANFLSNQYDTYKEVNIFQNKLFINSLTLQFNPINMEGYRDYIRQFMNLYHGKSDFLLIPSLKVIKYENKKRIEQVPFKDYKKYVDIAYDALSFRNSKPIFVPLSLKHGISKFEELLKEYIDFGYYNFWMDFEGSSSYSRTSYIRHFHSVIDEYGIIDRVILYATNMRREMNPHVADDVSAASDVVSSPLGIDILGVNRAPSSGVSGDGPMDGPSPEELFNHKARFLNVKDYGYVKYQNFGNVEKLFEKFNFDDLKLKNKPKFYTNIVNTFEINSEFNAHKEIIKHDIDLLSYLGEKSFVPNDKIKNFMKNDAKRKKKHNRKKPSRSLSDFL